MAVSRRWVIAIFIYVAAGRTTHLVHHRTNGACADAVQHLFRVPQSREGRTSLFDYQYGAASAGSTDRFGGVGPEVSNQRLDTESTGVIASFSAESWTIRLDRPTFRILPKIRCSEGRLKSASMRSVLCPASASTTARLA